MSHIRTRHLSHVKFSGCIWEQKRNAGSFDSDRSLSSWKSTPFRLHLLPTYQNRRTLRSMHVCGREIENAMTARGIACALKDRFYEHLLTFVGANQIFIVEN